MEKHGTDVAINIFGRPFQTSLSLLSLIKQSGLHIGVIWLQYEPVGIKVDLINSYCIYNYLCEKGEYEIKIWQPSSWLAREAVSREELADDQKRLSIRYQYAFENCKAPWLLLIHSDIFVKQDLIGEMLKEIDGAFAIGQIGQCWNCAAHHGIIVREVMKREACDGNRYLDFKPDYEQLKKMYQVADREKIAVRPYHFSDFSKEFKNRAWTLPECRVNEWSCLINMHQAQPNTAPFGYAYPPGANRKCGKLNLDTGVAWFRDMHELGFHAQNVDIAPFIYHWIGTASNTPRKYALKELNAFKLLQRHFHDYFVWLKNKYPEQIRTLEGA